MIDISAPCCIDFPNGYGIHVHEIRNDEVLYQLWPPGCEEQTWPNGNCFRRPIDDFKRLVAEAGGVRAEKPA